VELVDFHETPLMKDENSSYLTSVILSNEILEKNENYKNIVEVPKRIFLNKKILIKAYYYLNPNLKEEEEE
jgi:hypothetical protein